MDAISGVSRLKSLAVSWETFAHLFGTHVSLKLHWVGVAYREYCECSIENVAKDLKLEFYVGFEMHLIQNYD